MEPVSTWSRGGVLAAGESRRNVSLVRSQTQGLFMCLSPHRVPDRSHPCQRQSQSGEFPLTETLVTTVYSRPVIAALCRPHLRTGWVGFWKIPRRIPRNRGIPEPFVRCGPRRRLFTDLTPTHACSLTNAALAAKPIHRERSSIYHGRLTGFFVYSHHFTCKDGVENIHSEAAAPVRRCFSETTPLVQSMVSSQRAAIALATTSLTVVSNKFGGRKYFHLLRTLPAPFTMHRSIWSHPGVTVHAHRSYYSMTEIHNASLSVLCLPQRSQRQHSHDNI